MQCVSAGPASIPALGFGTWQNTDDSCTEAVRTALELGYRHIDTAAIYDNEAKVGAGIDAADVDRDEIFLTTKVWRSNLRADDVRDSLESSLKRLDVEYVDLLLAHWPHPRIDVEETLDAMAELKEEGLTRHIGVSNFTRSQLQEAMAVSDVPIVTDQVLYNPYRDQSELQSFCAESGVALTAYSPLGRGDAIGDEVLAEIGEQYHKSPAQVALRWLVQQENVVAIPKASSREHIRANLAVFDFELCDAEMERIYERTPGLRARVRNQLPGLMRRNPF